MAAMLCYVCAEIFSAPCRLHQWSRHHQSRRSVLAAAAEGCYVCSITTHHPKFRDGDKDPPFRPEWLLYPSISIEIEGLLQLDINGDEEGHGSNDDSKQNGDLQPGSNGDIIRLPVDGTEANAAMPEILMWNFILVPADCLSRPETRSGTLSGRETDRVRSFGREDTISYASKGLPGSQFLVFASSVA